MSLHDLDIKPLKREHTAAWWAAVDGSRDEILQWEGWPDTVRSEDDARTILGNSESDWAAGRAFHCGVFQGEALVGCVTLSNLLWDCRCADLGYWVHTRFRGQGIAAWASRFLVGHAFQVWRLERAELVIHVGNTASQRVAEKLGASFEGIARNRIFHPDRPVDARVYAILKNA